MDALLLGYIHLPAAQRPGFKDTLKAKRRLLVRLFSNRLCLGLRNNVLNLFWLAHL